MHVDESKKGCKLFGHIKNCVSKTKIDTMKKKHKDIYDNDGGSRKQKQYHRITHESHQRSILEPP